VDPQGEERGLERVDVEPAGAHLLDQQRGGRADGRHDFDRAVQVVLGGRVVVVDVHREGRIASFDPREQGREGLQPAAAAHVHQDQQADGREIQLGGVHGGKAVAVQGEEGPEPGLPPRPSTIVAAG
jgi:hypothetical protein